MKWFNVLAARLRALVRRDEVLNDIDEEMRAHIEMETEANRALGMTADEARLSAAKSFGNVGSMRDLDRKSTRLNSSHLVISYAVFCLKKKKQIKHGQHAYGFGALQTAYTMFYS